MKRVFISYATDDAMFRDALATHLQVVCAAGAIVGWHDGNVAAGEDWQLAIDREIHAADIVVLLVSASFLASKSCQELQLRPALERWEKRQVSIIPVIVRACAWEASALSNFQVLPRQGKPVAAWSHQDDAWTDVTRAIWAAATGHSPLDTRTTASHSQIAFGWHPAIAELRRYLEGLILEVRTAGLVGRHQQRIILEELFIPVRVNTRGRRNEDVERNRERLLRAGDADGRIYRSRSDEEFLRETGRTQAIEDPEQAQIVPWDRIRSRMWRCVILGDPGSGKSTLLRREALHHATHALRCLEGVNSESELLLPIVLSLPQLAAEWHRGEPFESLLGRHLRGRYGDNLESLVTDLLEKGRCILLLDTLEQLQLDTAVLFRDALRHFFERFRRCSALVASRVVGYRGSPFPRTTALEPELEIVAFRAAEAERFIETWFRDDPSARTALVILLREHAQLMGLAQNPLLLSLLCLAFSHGGLRLPVRRAELFEECIRGLLGTWRFERDRASPTTRGRVGEKLKYLGRMALDLFERGKESFTPSELERAAAASLEGMRATPFISGDPLQEIVDEDGLIVRDGRDEGVVPYSFLHLSLQEFLAARELAGQAHELAAEGMPWLPIVKDRLLDPRWREVLCLLSGQVDDPNPLVQALLDADDPRALPEALLHRRPGKDPFRNQLFLAATCLLEAHGTRRSPEVVAQVTTCLFGLFLEWEWLGSGVQAAAARLAGRLGDDRALHFLVARLVDPDSTIAACLFLGELGDRRGLEYLHAIPEGDRQCDFLRARSLVKLGDLTGFSRLQQIRFGDEVMFSGLLHLPVENLIEITSGEDPIAARIAAVALGRTGDSRALRPLLQLLQGPDESARPWAAYALGLLGNADAVQPLLETFSDSNFPGFVVTALGRIGDKRATGTLRQLLDEDGEGLKIDAAQALALLGDERGVDFLLRIFRDPTPMVKLRDNDYETREKKVTRLRREALRAIGAVEGGHLLEVAAEAVCHNEASIRVVGAEILQRMGNTDIATELLLKLLSDTDAAVRVQAASALGQVGDARAFEPLMRTLNDAHPKAQVRAAEALGLLGDQRAFEPIMTLFDRAEAEDRIKLAVSLRRLFAC